MILKVQNMQSGEIENVSVMGGVTSLLTTAD